MNSGCLRGWGRYLWTSECVFPSISSKGNYSSKCFREVCLVFDKSVLCISSNLEIGTLSGLLLLYAPHRWVYANHLDILYSFSVRGTLYSALMGTLVSNEKSDEIRCFEYRTCANFRSFIILLVCLFLLGKGYGWFWCKTPSSSNFIFFKTFFLSNLK